MLRRRAFLAFVLSLVLAGGAYAQRFGFREGSFATRYAPATMPDSAFVICRLQYRQVRSDCEKYGVPLIVWAYPRGSAIEGKGGKDSFYAIDYSVTQPVITKKTVVLKNDYIHHVVDVYHF